MKKLLLVFLMIIPGLTGQGQSFSVVPSISGEFSGICNSPKYDKSEFKPSVPSFNPTVSIDLIYTKGRLSHKLTVGQSVLGYNFRLTNKFQNNTPAIRTGTFGNVINHLVLFYSLQKEAKHESRFMLGTTIKFNISGGLGVGFNRSQNYYDEVYSVSSYYLTGQTSYMNYQAIHTRIGLGALLKGSVGFNLLNQKNRRFIAVNFFYNQGLLNMVKYDIHYSYGYHNDPQRQVDVPNQILYSRGTTFGLSLGFPITIRK